MVHSWTQPQDDHLRRCVVDHGRSYTEAAIEINATFHLQLTRNAAIRRAARIGLVQPRQPKPVKLATVAPRPRRMRKPKPAKMPEVPVIAPAEPIAIDLPGGSEALITVIDLKAHHCRFPLGRAPYHFCGAQRWEGYSYCAGHVRLTHNFEGRRV